MWIWAGKKVWILVGKKVDVNGPKVPKNGITRSKADEKVEQEFNMNTFPESYWENGYSHLETLLPVQWHSRTSQVSRAFFSNLIHLICGEPDKQAVTCLCVPISIQMMIQNNRSNNYYSSPVKLNKITMYDETEIRKCLYKRTLSFDFSPKREFEEKWVSCLYAQ